MERNENPNYYDPRISRAIELELEITGAIFRGHKCSEDDQFRESRKELRKLREELFGKKIKIYGAERKSSRTDAERKSN